MSNLLVDTEDISSCSDAENWSELEDGEVIDDSDSELSTVNSEYLKHQDSKYSSSTSVTGSDHIYPHSKKHSLEFKDDHHEKKRRKKCKENKSVLHKIQIQKDWTPTFPCGASREKDHDPLRKFQEMHNEWNGMTVDLITIDECGSSPDLSETSCKNRKHRKTRRKRRKSHHSKQNTIENSDDSSHRNSKKKCLIPAVNPKSGSGNSLLQKLVLAGEIQAKNLVLKKKNGELVTKLELLKPPSMLCTLNDLSSDESPAGHFLTLDETGITSSDYNSAENPFLILSPSHQSRSDSRASVICDSPSKTNEVASIDDNSIISVPKNVTQSYLKFQPENDASNDCIDVYSPETFVPAELSLYSNKNLDLLNPENAHSFLSENYDCIPMSCSEDEDGDNIDNIQCDTSEKGEKNGVQELPKTDSDEEEQELQLRIGALKTWLQKKYSKTKSPDCTNDKACDTDSKIAHETVMSSSNDIESLPTEDSTLEKTEVTESENVTSTTDCTENENRLSNSEPDQLKPGIVQNEEFTVVDNPEVKSDSIRSKADAENSILDDEANEDYEAALRSLLVSNLLKKTLKNSNELLTESSRMSKTSSSVKPVKKQEVIKNIPNKLKTTNLRNKLPEKSNLKSNNLKSFYKSDLSNNCDKFQSKFVFNSNETFNQHKENKNLLSNIKVPIVEKLIINLDVSDTESDSSESSEDLEIPSVTTAEETCAKTSSNVNAPDNCQVGNLGTLANPPSTDSSNLKKSKEELCGQSKEPNTVLWNASKRPSQSKQERSQSSASVFVKSNGQRIDSSRNKVLLKNQNADSKVSKCLEKNTLPISANILKSQTASDQKPTIQPGQLRVTESLPKSSLSKELGPVVDSGKQTNVQLSNTLSSNPNVSKHAQPLDATKNQEPKSVANVAASSHDSTSTLPQEAEKTVDWKIPGNSEPAARNIAPLQNNAAEKKKNQETVAKVTKKKLKKANRADVTDTLVPAEKKLLKSRLTLLQNLDSMQNCISSCEESAMKSSQLFAKVIQLQKLLKLATTNYKAQFDNLQGCVKNYKIQSQRVSHCFNDYAQVQKETVKIGEKIIGANYNIPKEGLSAMATKFKLIKEKKLEFLNKASLASEMKKASSNLDNLKPKSDLSSLEKTVVNKIETPKAVENTKENSSKLSLESLPSEINAQMTVWSITEKVPVSDSFSTNNVTMSTVCTSNSAEMLQFNGETDNLGKVPVINNVVSDSLVKSTAQCDSVKEPNFSDNSKSNGKNSETCSKSESASVPASIAINKPSDNVLTTINGPVTEVSSSNSSNENNSDEVMRQDSKCEEESTFLKPVLIVNKENEQAVLRNNESKKSQQSFKKYTSFFHSLHDGGKGEDELNNVDSIICPFSLQGTCRDESCEYKHIQN